MATASAYRNSGDSQPPKTTRNRPVNVELRSAACRLVKALGLVPSFRNLYVVELAITAESNFSSISLSEATDHIIECARIYRDELHQCLNYFWFEDACWRQPKLSFKHQDEIRMREKAHWY